MRKSNYKKKWKEKMNKAEDDELYASFGWHMLIFKHIQNLTDSYQSIENTLNYQAIVTA